MQIICCESRFKTSFDSATQAHKPSAKTSRTKLKAPLIFIFPDDKLNKHLLKNFRDYKVYKFYTVLPNLF